MERNAVYSRIDRYLAGASTSPIVVDVPDEAAYADLLNHYKVGSMAIESATSFCEEEGILQWEKAANMLRTREKAAILTGLDAFLKLLGVSRLKERIRQALDIQGRAKTVILTLGCRQWLTYNDPRLASSGKLSFIDGEISPIKTLCFVKPGLIEPDRFIYGVKDLPKIVKFHSEEVVVITDHKSKDFPESLFCIRDYDSSYQILVADNPEVNSISETFGTESEWDALRKLVEFHQSVEGTLIGWGGRNGLSNAFSQFEKMDSFDRWHYLLSLKLYGANTNKYLTSAARKSDSVAEFVQHICEDILAINPENQHFAETYNERKELLLHLEDFPDAVSRYCKLCLGKGVDGVQYLTDASIKEKETVIALLASFGKELGRKKVLSVLEKIYPSLKTYLEDFSYGNPVLDKYFSTYKFDKVVNSISDEMRLMVEEQSIKREYNSILQPRSLVVDKIDKEGTILYFMDAMGAEYLSYIQERLFENDFDTRITVARCELPSITSLNKDFVKAFEDAGCKVISRKDLDSLKHEGEESYDYQNTKLPIHIVRELDIIDQLVSHLKGSLDKGVRAYLIGDHGSSRLAVINETENKWEVSEKGKHSGRCCLKSEVSEKPDSATESNDFWCLANYDRFKGGRKAQIEVHGGATLEEVCVPIIEVTKRDKKISCEVKNDGPALRSLKTNPILKLFVEKASSVVAVEISGQRYNSLGCKVPYVHEFELEGIKRPGKYNFNVYVDGVLICRDQVIEVENQTAKERKLF